MRIDEQRIARITSNNKHSLLMNRSTVRTLKKHTNTHTHTEEEKGLDIVLQLT
jgi:hypothetical protein